MDGDEAILIGFAFGIFFMCAAIGTLNEALVWVGFACIFAGIVLAGALN